MSEIEWIEIEYYFNYYLNVTKVMLLIRYVKNEQRVLKFTESVPLLSENHLCVN